MTSSDFVFGSNIIVLLYCSMHFVASLLQSSYSQRCDVKTFGKPTFVDAWHPNRSQFHQHFMHTFCSNILAPKITKLCFGFEIFWRQNIGAKCWWNWHQNEYFCFSIKSALWKNLVFFFKKEDFASKKITGKSYSLHYAKSHCNVLHQVLKFNSIFCLKHLINF